MNNNFDCDVIVIGSGPAGLTASMYLVRAGFSVINISGDEPGGNLSKIRLIENYPGVVSCSGDELFKTMYKQCSDIGVKFYDFFNAEKCEKKNNIFYTYLDNDEILKSRAVIFAVGGKHRVLGLNNETEYFGNGISFCATCDGPLYENKDVVIIGGGNTAMDFAISLSNICKSVRIIHRRDSFRASADMIKMAEKCNNVSFLKGYNVRLVADSYKEDLKIYDGEDVTNDEDLIDRIDENLDRNDFFYFELHVENKNENKELGNTIVCTEGIFYALGFENNSIPYSYDNNSDGYFSCGDMNTNNYMQVITAAADGCKKAIDCQSYLKRC